VPEPPDQPLSHFEGVRFLTSGSPRFGLNAACNKVPVTVEVRFSIALSAFLDVFV
jgi:hypothetical protein